MLESLCIDLINELFLTKYNFLLAMKLNSMLCAKCHCYAKKEVEKDVHEGESPSPAGSSTPVLHVQEKYNYANFCDLKRKEMRKKKIKKINFKMLRKYVGDLKERRGVDCLEGEKDQPPPLEKSRNKQKIDDRVRMLNDELSEYICKDFYTFVPLYNFEEEPLLSNKNRTNLLISKEKMKNISKNRKKIKGTLRGGYTKGPVLLSSKKLNTHYVNFLAKFRMLIKRVKQRNNGGDTIQGDDPKYTILKTLLYLKGGSVSSTTSCVSSRDGRGRELARGTTHRKDPSRDLLLLEGRSEGDHYELYKAISTIRFLRESLHILRMDVIYIFVFFASYVNGILARLQGGRSGAEVKW
ncbi:hypothetical protein PCYB_083560 [Plasmodium cynomolgi strain B]|uniref:Uncharacterized protein n=1 Tax=Plasmodium cynomolgi (strain B) TaxID=1120755 RepID=K6UV98_PLACD|nr:hypothetical protein PCYB_083560 [Plasmodium cynomolgi strain B]GAB66195.1 hypothetical protein PCYB_083560 [Plasmodium cynomolgi strain B]